MLHFITLFLIECTLSMQLHGLKTKPELNGIDVKQIQPAIISKESKSFRIPVKTIVNDSCQIQQIMVKIDNIAPLPTAIVKECIELLKTEISGLSAREISQHAMSKPKTDSHLYCLADSINRNSEEFGLLFATLEEANGCYQDATPTSKWVAVSNLLDGIGKFKSLYLLSDEEKLLRVRDGGFRIKQIAMDILQEIDTGHIFHAKREFIESLARVVCEAAEKYRPGSSFDYLVDICDDLPQPKRRMVEKVFGSSDACPDFQGR